MPYRRMLALGWIVCASLGCGDADDDTGISPDMNAVGAGEDAGLPSRDGSEPPNDAGPTRLDPEADAARAARALCRLGPWLLGSLDARALPAERIVHHVREEQQVFVDDKPPICVDDPESGEDLCVEMPTQATAFGYLRDDGEGGSDGSAPAQVWCKSDSFEDLARIPGAEAAQKGECRHLHDAVVTWARAQLNGPSDRTLRYEPVILERGSQWAPALVETETAGDALIVRSPELYVPSKSTYVEQNGTAALQFVDDDFFGNHYCKVISPAAALDWLRGS